MEFKPKRLKEIFVKHDPAIDENVCITITKGMKLPIGYHNPESIRKQFNYNGLRPSRANMCRTSHCNDTPCRSCALTEDNLMRFNNYLDEPDNLTYFLKMIR